MTWPWATRALLDATAFEGLGEEERPSGGGDVAAGVGQGGGPPRAGAYDVAADLVVEGEFLEKAIQRIERLTITFRNSPTSTKYPPFPRWVLKLENLKGLKLVSYPHKELPEEIGNLKKLERFHAYGSGLTRLPRSMGRLENLIELDCYTSYQLHYLPYELTRCSKLTSSCFSTRALYNNYKNRMAVPPLQPWWQGDATAAPTPNRISQALGHLFSPEFTEQRILPFLPWDNCAVCGLTYHLGQGCHAWSHQRLATDTQSLLAVCCSPSCAAKVGHQIYFDPHSRTNKQVNLGKVFDSEIKLDLKNAVQAWNKVARVQGERRNQWYQGWTRDHLGVPWDEGSQANSSKMKTELSMMDRLSWTGTKICDSSKRFMMVVASGDVRMAPNSSSRAVDRLKVGRVVLVDCKSRRGNKNDREWVRLWISPGGESYWTAKTKKDGTLKLKQLSNFVQPRVIQAKEKTDLL